MRTSTPQQGDDGAHRVLAVADWSIDSAVVVETLRAGAQPDTVFGLLVPSRLPGLAWIGDPHASRPCAETQLAALRRLADQAGLTVEVAEVGDPERVAAIRTSVEAWPPARILVFDRERIGSNHRFGVARRAARETGRPVERIAVPVASAKGGTTRRAPRCMPAAAGLAAAR